MNFANSIPLNERSAADWELLISLYDKLNKLGELKPSGLPEDQRKKVIQLLENKKDYNNLMNFFNHCRQLKGRQLTGNY